MKKLFVPIMIFILILLMVGCTTKSDKDRYNFQTINEEHPNTGQEYSIINTFDLYNSFFNKVTNDLKQDKIDQIYKEEIINPIYNQCFAEGEYVYMVEFLLENAPKNKLGLMEVIENTKRKELHNNIIEALIRSSNFLSTNLNTTVCIFPNTDQDVPVMITVGTGKIILLYNSEYSEELIKATIAHEYHHSIWTERYLDKWESGTVLDNLVFEGKAVMFEQIVYPENNVSPIDPYYIRTFWEMIESDLDKTDLDRALEILSGDGRLPYLYGYSEGYKMVKSYLDKNPNLAPEDWLGTEAQVIFEEGEYLSNY